MLGAPGLGARLGIVPSWPDYPDYPDYPILPSYPILPNSWKAISRP
jgi:hypothetical protein